MSNFQELACRYFDFLCSRHGFRRTLTSAKHVRYESNKMFFDITTDWRDGICVDFGRFGQPGAVPQQKQECLSLQTFLAAIRTHEGTYRRETFQSIAASDFEDRTLRQLAAGLNELGRGLISGDEELYRLVRELRFWHVGEWTERWGTTIVLSPEEIRRHRHLVPDILSVIHDRAA